MFKYNRLWQAFRPAKSRPSGSLQDALGALPAVGALPSPWVTWTLIGLCRHRPRQQWVADVFVNKLGGNLAALAGMGSLGHPTHIAPAGDVPGLEQWEYFIHGRGCCLTHKVTREEVDADFFDATSEYVELSSYTRYLASVKHPPSPEARLIALHPSRDSIRLAVDDLLRAGLLKQLKGQGSCVFRLSETLLHQINAINAFCDAWESASELQLWLAASIGDWLAAGELAIATGDRALIEQIGVRAAKLRDLRYRELLRRRRWARKSREIVLALDDLAPPHLNAVLLRILRGPISPALGEAVQIVQKRGGTDWSAPIEKLWKRLNPSEFGQQHIWLNCLEMLLKQKRRSKALTQWLSKSGAGILGEAAILALEHSFDQAVPLFRRALRSPVPWDRGVASATLALIDEPWSRDELLTVLRETNRHDLAAESLAALLECDDEDATAAVQAWTLANPRVPEPGPMFSVRELSLLDSRAWVRSQMDQLADQVLGLRGPRRE